MKHCNWYEPASDYIETPQVIDEFLSEILEVCKKHGFSISHEDTHGSFEIVPYNHDCVDWLNAASINVDLNLGNEVRR